MTYRRNLLLIIGIALISSLAFAGDPPARVARLNYVSGQVSIQPGGVNDWVQGSINRPLTSSDRIWADKDSRAELELGGAALRLDSDTSLTLVNVSDSNVQFQLDQGTASLHVVDLFDGEVYEVDTPNVSFIVRKRGDYRFDVDNAGDTTAVTVFKGEGDATGDGPAVRVKKEERYTFSDGKSLRYAVNHNPSLDGFDEWAFARADREDRSVSTRYVSPYTVGSSDLAYYGRWDNVAPYGPIWYPSGVGVDWAPYRYGHWVWVSPWGWTWVDDAPWGFAPFHYGRWVNYRNAWGWCPGPIGVRPIYAPALVAWVGGNNWGVGLSFGIGGGVGWFPLGWGEPYIPYYGHSRGYFRNVNFTNTHFTNVNYINNYYGNPHGREWNYAYRRVPNAVTAVSNDTFRFSRPTRNGLVHVNERELQQASIEHNIGLRPTTNSVLGVNAGRHGAAPPATLGHPSRSEHMSVANSETPRPDRIARPNHDTAANNGGNPTWQNGNPNRAVPRPPNRGNPTANAEVERPRGIPNPAHMNTAPANNANAMPSRVPRPPQNGDRPQNYGQQPHQPVYTQNNHNQGVTHDVRPQSSPSRQSGPAHTAPAASKPAEHPRVERKVEKENGSPQGAVSYPRPYGNVRPANYAPSENSRNSYARTTSDYTPRSYSSPGYNTSATRPASRSYSYSQPSRATSYSQSARIYSAPSRTSSYSAPSRMSSYSASSRSTAHYSQPSSHSYVRSSGGGNRSGGASSHQGRSR
jgi:hypothetical protein